MNKLLHSLDNDHGLRFGNKETGLVPEKRRRIFGFSFFPFILFNSSLTLSSIFSYLL